MVGMDLLSGVCNTSQLTDCNPGVKYKMYDIISDRQRYIMILINYVILCGVISLLGAATNVVNLIIFYRQGLHSTINISFFSLAISDLFSLILQQASNIFVNPLVVGLDLPMKYTEVQMITARLLREVLARITFFTTVYITAERCLCIAFPLHIKQMITPRKTVTIILLIYVMTFASVLPLCGTLYLDWKFHPGKNRTLLGLAFRKYIHITKPAVYIFHAMAGVLAFFAVVALTLILIYKLGQKNDWRKTANASQDKAASMNRRDRGTVKMVVLIAGIVILCYIPSVMVCLISFFEPGFSEGGRYYNMYSSLWSVAILMENINSSVNIFFYFNMSSNYRQKFRELFSACLCNNNGQVDKHK